jgi:hypothetical protein
MTRAGLGKNSRARSRAVPLEPAGTLAILRRDPRPARPARMLARDLWRQLHQDRALISH